MRDEDPGYFAVWMLGVGFGLLLSVFIHLLVK